MAAPFPYAVAQTAAPMAAAPSGPALTQLTERFDQMDQQIRTLTGKVEELQFAQTQAQKTADSQQADTMRRLSDMEVRVNSVGGAAPAIPPTATAPAAAPKVSTTVTSVTTPSSAAPGAKTTTTSSTTVKTIPDDPVATGAPTTVTAPPSSEAPTPLTANGAAPDATSPIAAAPTVKPLGSIKADGTAQPGTPESDYEAAFKLLQDKKYLEAQTAFSAFIKANPRHDLAGNAQYWLGETYYARQDYKNAAKAFAEGYQKYRHAPKAADNLVKLGLSLEALGSKDDACVTFGQFKTEYQDAAPALKAKADAEIKKLGCSA